MIPTEFETELFGGRQSPDHIFRTDLGRKSLVEAFFKILPEINRTPWKACRRARPRSPRVRSILNAHHQSGWPSLRVPSEGNRSAPDSGSDNKRLATTSATVSGPRPNSYSSCYLQGPIHMI